MKRRKLTRILCLANRGHERCGEAADELMETLRGEGYQIFDGVDSGKVYADVADTGKPLFDDLPP